MNILTYCSFSEFNSSDFLNEFITKEKGKQVFATPTAKLIFCAEDCGYGEYLHTFYDKSDSLNSRWHKRLDVSNEQITQDCSVYLIGDKFGEPVEIAFELEDSLIHGRTDSIIIFTLTEEMKKALNEAKEYDFYDYYPHWH